jgi:hypothetical protein
MRTRFVVMSYYVAYLIDETRVGIEFLQYCPGHRRTLEMLIASGAGLILFFGFLDADVVKIGGSQYHRWVSFFGFHQFIRIAGDSGCMADSLEIGLEIHLHLHCDAVFEKVLLLLDEFRRQVAEALRCKFAVGCTAEVHFGIEHLIAALFARPPSFIFEELNGSAAVWTDCVKDCIEFPITGVLARAFHGELLSRTSSL